MVHLKIDSTSNGWVNYRYYPERVGDEFGMVSVNLSTGEATVAEVADGDGYGLYSHKAIKRVRQMLADGDLKDTAYMAWY